MVINFSENEMKNKHNMNRTVDIELGTESLTRKYDMDRICRDSLINMGEREDDRSEFDRKRDEVERDEFNMEVDRIIDEILSYPIN